jgi:hypothetical protein
MKCENKGGGILFVFSMFFVLTEERCHYLKYSNEFYFLWKTIETLNFVYIKLKLEINYFWKIPIKFL